MTKAKPANIDEYIAGFPEDIQKVLQQIRKTIKNAAPRAEETISYAIPAYMLNNTYLVYFAGYKKHVSIYPIPKGTEAFQKKIAAHTSGKGTIQFPLDKPVPMILVAEIVKYSIKANQERAKTKNR